MRYADTPTVEVEVEVVAPVERVWSLVTDINVCARFSPEFVGADWIDEGPALGATFRGRNHHEAIGEWATTSTVTRYEVNRVFEWTVGDLAIPAACWRFDLEASEGVVRLRQWARMGPGRSGLTPAIERMPDKEERIVARRLKEWTTSMTANVEGIKQLAEAEG